MANLKNIPKDERPYEKMLLYSEKSLSNSELLSIIIKTGTKEESSLEIAQKLINSNSNNFNNLSFLQELSIKELMQIKGIGKVKAIELKAVGEIAKRIKKPFLISEIKIEKESDIVEIFLQELSSERIEVLKIVMLDNKNFIKKISTIAVGNENNIIINIKSILAEPLKMQIPKIILLHNHPSGNPFPSRADIEFTKKVVEASKFLDIELLAHIIIGNGKHENVLNMI